MEISIKLERTRVRSSLIDFEGNLFPLRLGNIEAKRRKATKFDIVELLDTSIAA